MRFSTIELKILKKKVKKKNEREKRGIEQDHNPAIAWGTIKNQITQVGCNGRRHLDTHAKRSKEMGHIGCNR